MGHFVRYYGMRTSPRNTGIAVVYGEWPERVLRHRGYTDARRIWLRGTTPEEDAWLAQCRRFQALWYEDVIDLIDDERRVLAGNLVAVERLVQALRIYDWLKQPAAA